MTNIIKIFNNDIANGPGIRISVWFAGCSHGCKGCHNKSTWKVNQGKEMTPERIDKILNACDNEQIAGITLTGGDPLDIKLKNYEGAIELAHRFKDRFPNKTVWAWTGHLFEELDPDWLTDIDVVVDGEFVIGQKDISLQWRGSRNQRVIDVKKSLQSGQIVTLV